MENIVKQKTKNVSRAQIEEYKGWISDLRFSRTRDTNIFILTKIYWLNKAFISQVVDERGI
jgi:hypothetical protein